MRPIDESPGEFMKKLTVSLFIVSFVLTSCWSQKKPEKRAITKEEVRWVIENNPEYFAETFKKVLISLEQQEDSENEKAEAEELESFLKTPMEVRLEGEIVFGPQDAPLTLIEYSDFECPYCSEAGKTVKTLLEKYKSKIKFVYKHLPLEFHKNAMYAAVYFEAAALQDKKAALEFHFKIFEYQREFTKGGEKFLVSIAKKMGFDIEKMQKDAVSLEVMNKVNRHMEEAKELGFNGTPGFILNGIPLRGAYPIKHFEDIIKKLQGSGKLKL